MMPSRVLLLFFMIAIVASMKFLIVMFLFKNVSSMTKEHYEFIVYVSGFMQRFGFLPPIANWIGCQFALESAFGKSRIAKVKNNFCGMKIPRVRPSLNVNLGSGFATYESYEDCLLDYVLLLTYNRFGYNQLSNLDCFLAKLSAIHYCDDSGYLDSINNLYQQFKNYKNE